jgi:ubiquinone/menaquinone biosynthesis C-methylase UbiE
MPLSKSKKDLHDIKANWEEFAKADPLWSILPIPEKKGNRWTIEDMFAHGRDEIDSLMDSLAGLNLTCGRERALDFGCGVGRLTQALALYFAATVGVDISETMIRLAIQYNPFPDRCRYLANNRSDLRIFANDHFDFIYSNIVFQHIPPDLTFEYIRDFIRIIKPGGLIVYQMTTEELPIAGTKARNVFRKLAPRFLRHLYKKAKFGTWAIKDMYCISDSDMTRFVKETGGRILAAPDDKISLPRYKGKRYVVTK